MKTRALAVAALVALSPAAARAATIPSPSEFLGMHGGCRPDGRRLPADPVLLQGARRRLASRRGRGPRQDHAGRGPLHGRHLLGGEPREQGAPPGDRAEDRRPPRAHGRPRPRRSRARARSSCFITCNIHSTEIGASQMAMEWAHALATAQDAETRRRLDEVVLLLLPSINPDGQIMETEWYRKNLGTRYEGGPDALALPPLRRPRQQPRLVHAHPEGDAGRLPRRLPRVAPPGVAGRAPDGRDGPAHLHAAVLGAGGPRHPPPRLARREPHRREHGLPPRAGRQERASSTATSSTPTGPAARRTRPGGRTSPASSPRWPRRGSRRPSGSSRASSRAGARGSSSTAPRRTSRTPGRAGRGACATSWTTSGSSPTPSSRPAPSGAPTS